jgi:hypothetical protein
VKSSRNFCTSVNFCASKSIEIYDYVNKQIITLQIFNFLYSFVENLKTKSTNHNRMNAVKMEKVVAEVIAKLEKIKQTELASELSWCWVSFQNDSNPVGVAEKGALALDAFKAAREVNSKAVAKKLVDDLEKALA